MVSGRADVDSRVIEVLQLKLDGYTTAQTKDLTKHWNVSTRTIDKYISRATEKITEINLIHADETRGNVLTNLWNLFRINKQKGDIKELHRLLISIAKFSGLDKINVQVSGEGERVLKSLSDEELHNLVKEEDEDPKS